MKSLHQRIADKLGWVGLADVTSMSLHTLRDLVRPVDAALAQEITAFIASERVIIQQLTEQPSAESEAAAEFKKTLLMVGFKDAGAAAGRVWGHDVDGRPRAFSVASDFVREIADDFSGEKRADFMTAEVPRPMRDGGTSPLRHYQCMTLIKVITTNDSREVGRMRLRAVALRQYNEISNAAVAGPGFTKSTAKKLAALKRTIEANGGF